MPEKINFNNTINCSLQVGDLAYVSSVLSNNITTDPILVGTIIDATDSYIIVDKEPATYPVISPGMFMLFSKNIEVNESGLKGYYADVTFENHSNKSVELFAISSDVGISSK
tara:strand:+ start:146 stop:481 length:336 start_codon:yes stop_codon:yes gene_type:complete